MNVAIIGTGYVGLPTGIGLAELGHKVICVDKDQNKINDLNAGKITLLKRAWKSFLLKTHKPKPSHLQPPCKKGLKTQI